MSAKINLIGLSKGELELLLTEYKFEKFRSKQIWNWMYVQGVQTFEQMTNLPKHILDVLNDKCCLDRPQISKKLTSIDGTNKYLLKLIDNNEVETVYIPTSRRGTLCISSQVGCTLTCKFCHTGTQKLVRNLTASEIVSQFMLAKDEIADWPSNKDNRKLTNIVMMGQGEPFYNYENVVTALKIIMDSTGIKLSRHNITLSTSGVVPFIERCAIDLNVNLAISLHAVNDDLRNHLVPINKKYSISSLLDACHIYAGINKNYITFEYVMLKDVNDTLADAEQLIKLLRNIPAKINIIPFNSWPGSKFECSTKETIERFVTKLMNAGLMAFIRTPRGQDILAACGQLKSESERISKSRMNTTS